MKEPYRRTGDVVIRTIEEGAELTHVLCKVRRFGWWNWHPDDQERRPNWKLVLDEVADVCRQLDELETTIRWVVSNGQP